MKQAVNPDAGRRGAGRVRRVIGDVLIVSVALFTVYLCAVMLHRIHTVVLKDTYRSIFHHELLLCGVLLLFSLDLRFGLFTKPRAAVLRTIGRIMRVLVALSALVIVFYCVRVVSGGLINTAKECGNAIVLGMALQDGKPTKDLILRLDTARRYLEEYPDATLILTGGNPDETGLTEADVMRALLAERGVPEARMITEDKATTTRENFTDTAEFLDTAEPVVLISSSYHMDRAVRMAREAGFRQILRLPAPSDPLQYGANVMWEMIMDMNEDVNGR
jgi:uncharacterized SAM-binding protein YcdF (DUF218 family)